MVLISQDNSGGQLVSNSEAEVSNQPREQQEFLAEALAPAAATTAAAARVVNHTDEVHAQQQTHQHVIDITPSRPQSSDIGGTLSKHEEVTQHQQQVPSVQEVVPQEQQRAPMQPKTPADGLFITPGSQVPLSAQPQQSSRNSLNPKTLKP